MLQRLHIRNYAIIDELIISFDPGLNMITGETGAGKSILMGALGLVLGNRADTGVLFDAGEKCFVEAVFAKADRPAIRQVLESLDLDAEETLMLRREIAANGKSRSFVNDTPVTLQGLREVASLLVDLHRQFDTRALGDDAFQFEVLDALAGNTDLLKTYQTAFSAYKKAEQAYQEGLEKQAAATKEKDYTQFLYKELEELDLQPNELEELEEEGKLLANAETIKSVIGQVVYALDEEEPSLVQQIKLLANQLDDIAEDMSGLSPLMERMLAAQIELQDLSQELSRLNDRVSLDPERLVVVNDRLSVGYRLLKKHQCTHTEGLLQLQQQLGDQLSQMENLDAWLAKAGKEVAQSYNTALALAKKVSGARQKILASFDKQTAEYLSRMGMANARMQSVCTPRSDKDTDKVLHIRGMDDVQLLFDANKTGRFEPIEKVASGGELSRLMLAIKAQVAQSVQLPALIFDEIDTGISGEAAKQVGLLMRQLSANHQVIAITHQPQIAARAAAHFFVYKQEKGSSIKTRMRQLQAPEREEAIARMLSGETLTEASLKIAREMLSATD